jgi:DNA-directed RNA polymerase
MSTPLRILRDIVDRKLSFDRILADVTFASSEEASAVLQVLSKTAAGDPYMSAVVSQLGEAAALASELNKGSVGVEDTLPEIEPVTKSKVWSHVLD